MASNAFSIALTQIQAGNIDAKGLLMAAEAVRETDGAASVAALYKAWTEQNPNDPLLYAILYNAASAFTAIGSIDEAQACYERSISLAPDFAPSRINLGRVHETKGKADLAVAQWSAVIDRMNMLTGTNITHKTTALMQMSRLLAANNKNELVEAYLQNSLEIDPAQREIAQHYIAVRMRECKWPLIEPIERVSREILMNSIYPLSTAAYTDDPMLQLATNWQHNRYDVGTPAVQKVSFFKPDDKSLQKDIPLRIGYLSSDLREHAIGYLTAEVFELHDRKNVEVFAYYCGISRSDKMMERTKGNVDHWIPIQDMSDEAAAQRIKDDGIQILVDVNGYTRDARQKLLALRPAPVIVNWLGFPGSMASPYHHYIIADDWIIPPDHEIYYTEKVLRLPCYQPNDRKRVIAPDRPTRAEAGLPDNAMVYCCFNGTQKFSSFTFDRWMEILNRVPDSVLWLLGSTESSRNRLWALANAKGIAKERIIFAENKDNPHHLARYPLADLFLDTVPYGAHTTASDALWMGVPILTLDGRSFASRVCGSLVRAAGLPDLACKTPQEFVERAVALGTDKKALQHYRELLASSRDTCVLFDTPLLVRRLEGLYRVMWEDFKNNRLPKPDLRNLDVYLEVGITHDCDKEEVLQISDYRSWWQERLAQRNATRPIYPDNRLWTEEIARKQKN